MEQVSGWKAKTGGGVALVVVLLFLVLSILWSSEPEQFSATEHVADYAEARGQRVVVGYTTAVTLMHLGEVLLNKDSHPLLSGGYLSNDIMLPGIVLDNVPNWEFGVLVQIRDMARALRKDFSRSQSQSIEDEDLIIAEPRFHFDNDKWILPATEDQYQHAIEAVARYVDRLADTSASNAQFYARADNLRAWLADVETRLGSLSQNLSASVGREQLNVDLAGDDAAEQSTDAPVQAQVKTPWSQIDDVFYEARGQTWALIHLFRALEVDFANVLRKKNALVSLRQIIRELEATQQTVMSPMILNGDGMGMLANHSLVMANYISRANAAITDLRELLFQG